MSEKSGIVFGDKEGPKVFNRLAREQMKHRLLTDILADMQVCELEGWDKLEYLNELREMLDGLGKEKESNHAQARVKKWL